MHRVANRDTRPVANADSERRWAGRAGRVHGAPHGIVMLHYCARNPLQCSSRKSAGSAREKLRARVPGAPARLERASTIGGRLMAHDG
jgi:hypothetical protein